MSKHAVFLALAAFAIPFAGSVGEARPERPADVLLLSGFDLDLPAPPAFDSSQRLVVDRQKRQLVVQGSTDVLLGWIRSFPRASSRVVSLADDSDDTFLATARRLLGRSTLDAPGLGVLLRTPEFPLPPYRAEMRSEKESTP